MDKNEKLKYEMQAAVIKALAHPTRLFIVERINREEICMCRLAAEAGSDITTVSKHVALLKQAGVVRVEKRGTQIFPKLKCVRLNRLLETVDDVLRANARDMQRATA